MNLEEYERMYRFEDTYWWFIARRKLIATLLADLKLSQGIDILDIGCGTGAMLDELTQSGNVVGADFSPEALAFCKLRGERKGASYNLVRADARQLPFASNSFDIVTAMDIIEHIDRDGDAASEIYRVLKPGGYLLATVPAYQSLWSEHDDALHHHRRYTAKHFKRVLNGANLKIQRLSYTVTSVLPLVWTIRQVSNLRRKKVIGAPKADVVPVPAAVNKTLTALINLETQIVRRFPLPFGVTVVAVARKQAES